MRPGRDYKMRLYIEKTHLKMIDLPNSRCDEKARVGISRCTIRYLERLAGCSMPWEVHHSREIRHCNSVDEYFNYTGNIEAWQVRVDITRENGSIDLRRSLCCNKLY